MAEKITLNSAPSAVQDFFMRLGIVGELLTFLWKRKLYWMIPLIMTLLIFAVLFIIGGSSPLGAIFIYPIF